MTRKKKNEEPAAIWLDPKELQELEGTVHFRGKEADELSALLMRGSATAMRKIRGSIRRRSRLPVKISTDSPGERPEAQASTPPESDDERG